MNKFVPASEVNRRDFLRGSSFATLMMMMGAVEITAQEKPAAPGLPAGAASNAKTKAAADKPPGPPVNCAVIGLGAWGRDLLGYLGRLPNAPVTSICETYPASLRRAAAAAPKATTTADYRTVLDDKSVQAVIVATPSHQHKEIVLAALQAGKHVYCEAPLAHTIEDARAIAKAAAAAKGQIFQVGLQYRTNPQHHHVLEFVRTGAAGKITLARGQWHKKESWRRTSPKPEREKELNWRLDLATSPGLIGEIGIQQIDVASWFLRGLPVAVSGFGSTLHWNDGRTVPDTVQAVFEYADGVRTIFDSTLTNSFESNYDVFFGTDSAIIIRENRAWMFKEADSPLLGWEVYARKDEFFGSGETGIALVANATKLLAQGLKPAEGTADSDTPAFYSLKEFIENINYQQAPNAGYKEGFEATVVALKAHEATLKNTKIEFKKEWLEI